jgi:hypothetical protein
VIGGSGQGEGGHGRERVGYETKLFRNSTILSRTRSALPPQPPRGAGD